MKSCCNWFGLFLIVLMIILVNAQDKIDGESNNVSKIRKNNLKQETLEPSEEGERVAKDSSTTKEQPSPATEESDPKAEKPNPTTEESDQKAEEPNPTTEESDPTAEELNLNEPEPAETVAPVEETSAERIASKKGCAILSTVSVTSGFILVLSSFA